MCGRKNNNRYIGEDEYVNRYMRQAIPYEGFVTGLGYSFFRYDTICPATCNLNGNIFWDRYTPTLLVQAIDTSDYMKECSWNVSIEDLTKLLVRTNPDGTTTVSLGKNNEVILSKEHGKLGIRINDTGSEINVDVAVTDCKYENGVKTEEMARSQSCRLKDFPYVFDAVDSSSSGRLPILESGIKDVQGFDWMDGLNFGTGNASVAMTIWGKSYKYNELWHQTKTRGVSWQPQSKWKNPGAKYWRNVQTAPLKGVRTAGRVVGVGVGGALVLADVALSGEIKWSHTINAGMVAISWTGVGSLVAGAWFIADFGTMGVNYLLGNGAVGLGDMIDNAAGGPIIDMYEGLY
jgi:hypothetical protein